MTDEVEPLLVRVRTDTAGFAREVAAMRASLEGPLEAGAARAGRTIETTLTRAIHTGKLGFEDLKRVALSALAEIGDSAIRGGIGAILGGGGTGGGSTIGNVLGALIGGGFPGRATGGPVTAARPYLVGERGPELFVPTAAGRIEAAGGGGGGGGGGGRTVNVAIRVQADAGAAPEALRRSSRQVARAVRAALAEDR